MDLGQHQLGLPQQGQQQGQQPAAAGQNDQLAQMINKLLGMWSSQQKQQQQQAAQQQQPAPQQQTAQTAPAQNGWTPYRVPIPDHLQQYFQGAQNG